VTIRKGGPTIVLDEVLAAIPDIVLVVDCDRTILYINRVEPGFDRDAVIGQSADTILPPDSMAVFDDALAAVYETGAATEYEVMVPFPDGSEHWYRSRMSPMTRDGAVVAAIVMAVDVSELKEAQAAVERLRRLLPICAWCDRIQRHDGDWERLEEYLERSTGSDVTHGMCPDCHARQLRKLDSGAA
jgi:PAS domain S-box-containing protein